MEIGEEQETIIVEPAKDPFKKPQETPTPVEVPDKVEVPA